MVLVSLWFFFFYVARFQFDLKEMIYCLFKAINVCWDFATANSPMKGLVVVIFYGLMTCDQIFFCTHIEALW